MTDSSAAIIQDILGVIHKLQTRVSDLEQLNGGMLVILSAGVRSIFESHPSPYLLREAWDRQLAGLWSETVPLIAAGAKYSEGMRQMQELLQDSIGR